MSADPRAGATWTVLGSGSILPRVGHGPAGYALRPARGAPVTLFDCGPGTLRSLAGVGIGLEEVERVVISHFHPDHTLDLSALFFARRNPHLSAVLPELELIGPVGLAKLVEAGRGVYGRWVADPRLSLREVQPAAGDQDTRVELSRAPAASPARARDDVSMQLLCRRTGHTPEALAWRANFTRASDADAEPLSVTFSGDTGEVDDVARLARGTQLFCCECSFAEEERVAGHLSPRAAGRLAARAGCERLLLTHFYPGLEPQAAAREAATEFGGEILTASDGAVFELG